MFSPARWAPSARAWAWPSSFSGWSLWPCQRPARFQSVSPWRASRMVVIAQIIRSGVMDLELTGLRVLVTGGSDGIGLAAATLLRAEGAAVAIAARNPAAAAAAIGATPIAVDLSEPDGGERAVAGAVAALGGLDVLVNNVGTAHIATFEELTDADWDAAWNLNVMSHVRCIRAALPALRESQAAAIVNVASTAGKRPSGGMPEYSVTKAAVLSLSRLVADLYAKSGIRSNAVCPGPTLTPAWVGAWRPGRSDRRRIRSRPRRRARGGGKRPAAGADGDRRGDRDRDRVPLLAARLLRHRRRVERRRRHRARHHLSGPSRSPRSISSARTACSVAFAGGAPPGSLGGVLADEHRGRPHRLVRAAVGRRGGRRTATAARARRSGRPRARGPSPGTRGSRRCGTCAACPRRSCSGRRGASGSGRGHRGAGARAPAASAGRGRAASAGCARASRSRRGRCG